MLKWLKELRKCKGLSTYAAAKVCGISQSLYWAIENGKRSISINAAKKIANAFEFEWTKFFE